MALEISTRADGVVQYTADIVSAFLTHNPMKTDEVAGLIRCVKEALMNPTSTSAPAAQATVKAKPVVQAARSVFADHIFCLQCGKKMTMLKRHLMTEHGLTIDQYRSKYALPRTYPMTAPDYGKIRSGIAKKIGLGKRTRTFGSARRKR